MHFGFNCQKGKFMHHKNNLYLKILLLSSLSIQIASASVNYLVTYYIPVDAELYGNTTSEDGIKLHKAIAYTWYPEPESAIGFITQKYIAHTPHKGKKSHSMQNYNVNLAYIKGLKVDLLNYGSKECRVVMDSSHIISTYPPVVLDSILRYVKKATKLNMKEHNIDCPFNEIKTSKNMK